MLDLSVVMSVPATTQVVTSVTDTTSVVESSETYLVSRAPRDNIYNQTRTTRTGQLFVLCVVFVVC